MYHSIKSEERKNWWASWVWRWTEKGKKGKRKKGHQNLKI
jgi:hypothetical protein